MIMHFTYKPFKSHFFFLKKHMENAIESLRCNATSTVTEMPNLFHVMKSGTRDRTLEETFESSVSIETRDTYNLANVLSSEGEKRGQLRHKNITLLIWELSAWSSVNDDLKCHKVQ